MNDLVGHFLILVGAAIAISVLSFLVGLPRQAKPTAQSIVTVTIPQSASAPANRAPSTRVQPTFPPRDLVSLTREIQRELKRVGCYDGEASGKWNAQLRAAMKTFMDRVNARLPLDRPDFILLKLVQAHEGVACGTAPPKSLPSPPPSLLYEGRVPSVNPRAN